MFSVVCRRVSIMLGAWGFMLLFDEEWDTLVLVDVQKIAVIKSTGITAVI